MERIKTYVCGQCKKAYPANIIVRSYYSDTGYFCEDCWDYVKEMGEDYSSSSEDDDYERKEWYDRKENTAS